MHEKLTFIIKIFALVIAVSSCALAPSPVLGTKAPAGGCQYRAQKRWYKCAETVQPVLEIALK